MTPLVVSDEFAAWSTGVCAEGSRRDCSCRALPDLCVIAPAYNEEAVIGDWFERALRQRDEIAAVVDNVSTDGTSAVLERMGAGCRGGSVEDMRASTSPRLQADPVPMPATRRAAISARARFPSGVGRSGYT